MHVLVAPDKFKGTATGTEVAGAMACAARGLGHQTSAVALSDGGDGLLAVFGGANRATSVTGPLGDVVYAGWRLEEGVAVIESALASGLVLAGGINGNDALAATSRGTGELIEAALRGGASRIVVGLGGSACTDGGLGALEALSSASIASFGRGDVELVVCCDVRISFLDAAKVFGPQKGADAQQVGQLTARLTTARASLRSRFGVDVGILDGSGAAGGLAGGLAAVGGLLRPGFDVVASHVGFDSLLATASLVVTGEGTLDVTSFEGKVVGGVTARARARSIPVVAVVGDIAAGYVPVLEVISLVQRFGADRATEGVLDCVEDATVELLSRRRWG